MLMTDTNAMILHKYLKDIRWYIFCNYIGAKAKRKRNRLEWIHRFPSCVFTLGGRNDQSNFRFRFHIRSNRIPPLSKYATT